MVIGNGFFTETEQDAMQEMTARCGCQVKPCVFPTVGNISYYISENGDLYGMQKIASQRITRTKKNIKNKSGYTARLQLSAKKEVYIPLQVLTYCTFVLKEWMPEVELQFINGDVYDVRPSNLKLREDKIPQEWTERVGINSNNYKRSYNKLCYTVAFFTGISLEDAQDIVSQQYLYLCTEGFHESIKTDDDFIGLWCKMSKLRALDFVKGRKYFVCDKLEQLVGVRYRMYETNLFKIQPGEKRQKYLWMWANGYTATEIARECGCTLSTVSSSLTRSIQFLQDYLKNEIKL